VIVQIAYVLAGIAVLYALFVIALVAAGRKTDARAVAGFVPDCVVLFSRLLRDARVPKRHKLLVGALIPYGLQTTSALRGAYSISLRLCRRPFGVAPTARR
jgi:hypothetical protein